MPGKSNCGTEIIPLLLIDSLVRIGGVRPNVNDLRQVAAHARLHPVVEASARQSKQSHSSVGQTRGEPVLLPGYSVVIPAQSEVECQTSRDLPVVLKEGPDLILVDIPDLERIRQRISPFRLEFIDEAHLRKRTEGPRQPCHQVLSNDCVSATKGTGAARQTGPGDTTHRSQRGVTDSSRWTEGPRLDGPAVPGLGSG